MKFKYLLNKELPRLAWCAVVLKDSDEVNVYHGIDIETKMNFFVEGAWNGDFMRADFDTANFFMGSGAKKTGQGKGVLFSTSNHTLERLYSFKENDVMYVSNSMPFLLYMSENNLKLNYLEYESDFNSILKGINQYQKNIVLEDEKHLQVHYYCNFYIDENFNVVEMSKSKTKEFMSYDDYYNSLIKDLESFVMNASNQARKNKYGMITTISRGYDATACAAVAIDLGCQKAVSFDSPAKYAEDCGDEIARNLGFKEIITKNANLYLENKNLIEAEFVSSGELGTGIVFTAFENEFRNKIVFIGERGDKLWDKNRVDSNCEFRFDNEVFSGTSLIENRLRVGYIVMPMPLYRAENWPSIHRISNSKEMQEYSVGGKYDRPIPRRIIETKGIKRDEFGVEKKGAGFNYRFDNLSRLKKRMSKDSFDSFYQYYQENKEISLHRLKSWVEYFWGTKDLYVSYVLKKIGVSYKYNPLSAEAHSNPGAPSFLILWGNHVMINRYKESKIDRWWINAEEEI